jgi:hypothetical protein
MINEIRSSSFNIMGFESILRENVDVMANKM